MREELKDTKSVSKFEKLLCRIQGKVFENSLTFSFSSEEFINRFMKSQTAAFFDLPYDRTQWLGEESLMQDFIEEVTNLSKNENQYSKDSLFWIGYTYRYWHFYTGESSKQIVEQCDASTMNMLYPAYHTLDVTMAIERIKEAKEKRIQYEL